MSRLADRLMRMDKGAPRPQGVGGIPSLGPESGARRGKWHWVAALVIVGMMGVFLVVPLLRPQVVAPRGGGSATLPPPVRLARPAPAVSPAPARPASLPAPSGPTVHDRARALVEDGLEAARARDFQEASRLLTRALDLDPSDAQAWNSLGVVLIRQGEATRGVGALRRALRIDPGHAEAHRNLAVALDGQGRCREAALHYRSFMSRSDAANPYREDVGRRLGELQPDGRSCE